MDRADWPTAAPFVPPTRSLRRLADAAAGCTGCPLYANATQTVFGRGPARARLVVVGEQPGDVEDREGEPFVGPAGRLLDRALADAGIDRAATYLTNAVKHFKFTPSGKRRIHATPDRWEVAACTPWLDAELAVVHPELVVALGATAGKALLGNGFRVTKQRGQLLDREAGPPVLATLHPSAVLRADDRETAYASLVADLEVAAAAWRR